MNHRTSILIRKWCCLKHPQAGRAFKHACRAGRRVWQSLPWVKRAELRRRVKAEIEDLS